MESPRIYLGGKGHGVLGNQLVVELYECKIDLDDLSLLEKIVTDATRESGATIIKTFFHHFSPYGVSGVIVIAESHVAIHTWPEYNYCALDVFTCGESVDLISIFDKIRTGFKSDSYIVKDFDRGIFKQKVSHKPNL